MKKVFVYCDGSCSNNGKENAIGGIAFWLKPKGYKEEKFLKASKTIRTGTWSITNQRAEVICAIEALKVFKKPAEIELISDSQYLIETMKGNNKRKTNLDLWAELDNERDKHSITWTWLPRCSIPELAWCDKMAVQATKGKEVYDNNGQSS